MIEELVGCRLVAVERMSWQQPGEQHDRTIGPVRMVFDTGLGLVLDGKSDLTLRVRITSRGDDSWRSAYNYDYEGGRWHLRDAAREDPFTAAMNNRLTDWDPVYNEMHEVVGLRMRFGETNLSFNLIEGEIST